MDDRWSEGEGKVSNDGNSIDADQFWMGRIVFAYSYRAMLSRYLGVNWLFSSMTISAVSFHHKTAFSIDLKINILEELSEKGQNERINIVKASSAVSK